MPSFLRITDFGMEAIGSFDDQKTLLLLQHSRFKIIRTAEAIVSF